MDILVAQISSPKHCLWTPTWLLRLLKTSLREVSPNRLLGASLSDCWWVASRVGNKWTAEKPNTSSNALHIFPPGDSLYCWPDDDDTWLASTVWSNMMRPYFLWPILCSCCHHCHHRALHAPELLWHWPWALWPTSPASCGRAVETCFRTAILVDIDVKEPL